MIVQSTEGDLLMRHIQEGVKAAVQEAVSHAAEEAAGKARQHVLDAAPMLVMRLLKAYDVDRQRDFITIRVRTDEPA